MLSKSDKRTAVVLFAWSYIKFELSSWRNTEDALTVDCFAERSCSASFTESFAYSLQNEKYD